MLRQLLTLLAVFGGLTVSIEPAQALEAGVQTVQQVQDGATCAVQQDAISRLSDSYLRQVDNAREDFCRAPVLAITTPTIMLKADRARE